MKGKKINFFLFFYTYTSLISVIGTPFYLMRYVNGRVLKDPALPGVSPAERHEIYSAMCRVLADIHRVDINRAQLEDFGKHGTVKFVQTTLIYYYCVDSNGMQT